MLSLCRQSLFTLVATVWLVLCGGTLETLPSFTLSGLVLAQESGELRHELNGNLNVELRLEPTAHFVLSGFRIPEDAAVEKLFSVSASNSGLERPPALLGEYAVNSERSEAVFQPRYPLSEWVEYEVHLGPDFQTQVQQLVRTEKSSPAEVLRFRLPKQPAATRAQIAAVYPSASKLPENLLKFYLEFSQPMSRGSAYEHIQLFANGIEIEEPFLELGEELWDREQQRFTLLIHPGRIKRGLLPREQQGPAIEDGKSYVLRIDANWKDASGHSLQSGFEKRFEVTAPDSKPLDPESWRMETPKAKTTDAVTLNFDEPLDHAMLQHALEVKRRGDSVVGFVETTDDDRRWQFTPEKPWEIGTYTIEIPTNLEDLCGNSIARPFEVNLQQAAMPRPAERIAIEFIVK